MRRWLGPIVVLVTLVSACGGSDTVAPPAGEEITHTIKGPRTFTLSISCFAGVPTEAASPRGVLDAVISKVRKPIHLAALNIAKVGFASAGDIVSVAGDQNAGIEPRASVIVTFHTVAEETETGTYIETATIDGTSPVIPPFTVTIV